MTDLGNRYALSALRAKRGELAGEIVQLKKKLAWAEGSLRHIDASLEILDPSRDPTQIPAKRPQKRIKLFRQGELSGMLLAILRASRAPMPTRDIITALMVKGGHGETARKALGHRVSGNLAYLVRTGRACKTGKGRLARWAPVGKAASRVALVTHS